MKEKPSRKLRVPVEWLGLGCALLTAGGIYAGLIHPSLASMAALDSARASRETAVQELGEAQRQHQALLSRISDQQQRLQRLGGSPPSLNDKEAQLARIASVARDCRLALDQYSPLGDVNTPDYSAVYVQFTGRGPFPQVRDFFHRVESEMDYVDITHFTLVSAVDSAKPADPACVVTWSCKLSGMPSQPAGPAGPEPPVTDVAAEVALHEP